MPGVRAASSPWIALIGPECEFEPTVLLPMIRPVLEWPGHLEFARGARLASGGLAGQIAAIESLRAWLGRLAAFSGWNILSPIPGCSMLLKRDAIVTVGGFRAGALEMFLRLHALARASGTPYRVALVPDPISRCRLRVPSRNYTGSSCGNSGDCAVPGFPRELGTGAFPARLVAAGTFCDRFLRPLLETAS